MKWSEAEVPKNETFGFFFSLVFAVTAGYFYFNGALTWAYVFAAIALAIIGVTMLKAEALLFPNKLWMRFGQLLGIFASPFIFGLIFFGLFTPIAFLMRLSGRDELLLKVTNKNSYWISRNESIRPESFKNQF